MKEKIYKIHASKEFLNKAFYHSDASIFSEIEIYHHPDDATPHTSVSCKIRDCDRTIQLSFVGNRKDFSNSYYKIDKIISHLEKFKKGLKKAEVKIEELYENRNRTNTGGKNGTNRTS